MTLLRRVSYGALALAFAHIVFGAIVRITGSGLGCGDHWPRCHGYWFPPLTRMDLVIEVSHRYLAFALSATIVGLLVLAFTRRRTPGVSGPGGVLRPIGLATVLVIAAALFGALTVKFELRNKGVIVVHLAIAISTLASLAMAVVRAGGLGGAQATAGSASPKTWRAARAAAGMAFAAVVLGGLTAHIVGANGACVGFPHCSRGIPTPGGPLHVHLAHRAIAFLLFFHLLGMVFAVRKRGESPLMQWAVRIAFGTVLLQIVVAAALVELYLPPVLRSLHQAMGTLVWLSIFVLAVLARRGSRGWDEGARLVPPAPLTAPTPESGALRRGAAGVATGVATLAAEAIAPMTPMVPVAMAEPVAPAVAIATTTPAAAMPAIVMAPAVVPAVEAPVFVEDAVAEEIDEPVVPAAETVEIEEVLVPAEMAVADADVVAVESVVADADEADADDVIVESEIAAPTLTLDEEVAARLEAVLGRDPFEDDEDELVAEDEELDADDDFAAAIAAALGDEPETDIVAGIASDLDEVDELADVAVTHAAAVTVADEAPVLAAADEPAIEAVVIEAIVIEAPVLAAVADAPVVTADVAVLPAAAPKRPPTVAVLIARGADF